MKKEDGKLMAMLFCRYHDCISGEAVEMERGKAKDKKIWRWARRWAMAEMRWHWR